MAVDPETRHELYRALWDIHRGVKRIIGIPLKPDDKTSHLDEKVDKWLADRKEEGTSVPIKHHAGKRNRTYYVEVDPSTL